MNEEEGEREREGREEWIAHKFDHENPEWREREKKVMWAREFEWIFFHIKRVGEGKQRWFSNKSKYSRIKVKFKLNGCAIKKQREREKSNSYRMKIHYTNKNFFLGWKRICIMCTPAGINLGILSWEREWKSEANKNIKNAGERKERKEKKENRIGDDLRRK